MPMTLREAMQVLELNDRTLDASMLESAALEKMRAAKTLLEQSDVIEAYRRVQIFIDPTATLNPDAAESQALERPRDFAAAAQTDFELDLWELKRAAQFPVIQAQQTAYSVADQTALAIPQTEPSQTNNDDGIEANPAWTQLQNALEPNQKPATPILDDLDHTFDDSLLHAVAKPNVPTDERALTVVEDYEGYMGSRVTAELPAVKIVPDTKTTTSKNAKTIAGKSATSTTPIKPNSNTSTKQKPQPAQPNTDRRTSRAAKISKVSKAYDPPKSNRRSGSNLWLWFVAATALIGTGIFAAPMLLKQLSRSTTVAPVAPRVQLSVPTVPPAPSRTNPIKPKPKPVAKPAMATKPLPKPKPVAKPATKPVAKPAQTATTKPAVAKPTSTPAPKPEKVVPVATPAPQPAVVQTPVQPVAPKPKPQAKPKPKPAAKPPVPDAQSATVLPPITENPAPPVVIQKPTTKPKPKPATKPTPKPIPVTIAPQQPPVAAAPTTPPEPVLDVNNLSREQIGRRFLNEKYFDTWQIQGAVLKFPSWADIPLAIQVLPLAEFRSAVLISLP